MSSTGNASAGATTGSAKSVWIPTAVQAVVSLVGVVVAFSLGVYTQHATQASHASDVKLDAYRQNVSSGGAFVAIQDAANAAALYRVAQLGETVFDEQHQQRSSQSLLQDVRTTRATERHAYDQYVSSLAAVELVDKTHTRDALAKLGSALTQLDGRLATIAQSHDPLADMDSFGKAKANADHLFTELISAMKSEAHL